MRAPSGTGPEVAVGDVLLSVENVSLAFGGVKAVSEVSFDIRKGEIRAIIGPNGAGKTSMLNIINGFYQPQQGRITFKGETRAKMRPHDAAHGGIARTFQNVALFRGMTALDNIMAGRSLKMHKGLVWQLLRYGPAMAEEVEHRHRDAVSRLDDRQPATGCEHTLVRWADHPLAAGEVVTDPAAAVGVVAEGDDVRAGREQPVGELRRYPGAVGDVLAVDDREVGAELLAQARQALLDRAAAGDAEHVCEEEDLQRELS